MCRKVYVEVTAEFKADGQIIPLSIIWEDGHVYNIDKITDICQAASLKAGGAGLRYNCMIYNKPTFLFLEEDKWFMEAKI